jgi:hypothetical protein
LHRDIVTDFIPLAFHTSVVRLVVIAALSSNVCNISKPEADSISSSTFKLAAKYINSTTSCKTTTTTDPTPPLETQQMKNT